MKSFYSLLVTCSLILLLGGCGTSPPEVIQASGTIKINGNPLPRAVVKFIPMADGLDSSHIATGMTDDEGKFELKLASGPGVYCGLNKVTVQDEEAPEEARSMSADGAEKWNEYKASLKNRPIPKKYMSIGETPFSIEVTADKKEYALEISRR